MSAIEKKQQEDRRAGAVGAARANTVPALTDSRVASIVLAADRFMARSEIAATIFHGSNGGVARLPSDAATRLALWETWPDAQRCMRLAHELDRALADPADAEQVSEAVTAMIAAFPTGDRAACGYREAMASILTEEVVARGWSSAAVTRGLLTVARASRFLPAPVEVLDAVAEAHLTLRHAAWAARRAVELGYDLKWGLIDEGLTGFEDDGEAF
jgi:hypothetical protein